MFVWDVRGDLTASAVPPSAAELAALWADLASADAAAAFRTVRRLAHHPAAGVPFLREKLPPAAGVPADRIAALIADLDSPRFADREAAGRRLRALGPLAGPALRAAVATASPEARRRIEPLLAALDAGTPSADELRAVRAVEAVEWVRTADADRLLAAWAAGADGARLTAEAKEAVGRRR